MSETTFYHAFEAAFRGSRDEILQRLQGYGPFVTPLSESDLTRTALDLGCGRGEWLETLGQFGFQAHGVDLDESMLADCVEVGLSCAKGDAMDALAACEDDSLGILSAFHLIEHLPFDTVRAIVSEGLRVLAPGGLLILETPNPENIEVGTVTFHNDSTHVAPIPPNVLKFLAEHEGYAQIKLLRLNAASRMRPDLPGLSDVLFRASPDYALVAQKAGPDGLMQATALAFSSQTGPSTQDLANRHDEVFYGLHEAAFHALPSAVGDLHRETEKLAKQGEDLATATDVLSKRIETLSAENAALQKRLSVMAETSGRHDGQVAHLMSEVARLKKIKKTRFYYRSKKIQKLDKKITRWFIDRRERRRAKAAGKQEQRDLQILPALDRSRPWDPASLPETLHWRIEGPFDSSYSLALVNRELARALQRQGVQVRLKSSEGPGDFEPDPGFMALNPDLRDMQSGGNERADTVSRNMYPPRVADMEDNLPGLNSYAWEETGFPQDYATSFNDVLRYLTVTSEHVRKVMIDNGVYVPAYSVGNGVDHLEAVDPEPVEHLPKAGRVFLHVSSCFPRKGADALLAAWAKAFTDQDDVALVIKSFPNPHNDIGDQIAALRVSHPEMALVHLIEDDLSEGQMRGLYSACDVAVFPSRAEGFGLPLAEALLAGKPVLTTGWSGQMDFADLPLVQVIDYEFDQAQSHLGAGSSMWADPDPEHLADLLRQAAKSPAPSAAERDQTREILLERFSWDRVAQRSIAAVRHAAVRPKPIPPRIGWVTTYNARCGIATYSEHLIRYLGFPAHVLAARTEAQVVPDESLGIPIHRCWNEGRDDDLGDLLSVIRSENLQSIVVQFNYGFFNFEHLARLIEALKDDGRQVVLMLHATDDSPHPPAIQLNSIRSSLARCDRLLVHKILDANRMKALGLVENVALFPHGVLPMLETPAPREASGQAPFVIGSYGFFLPNKGLSELVEAIRLLREDGRDVQLRMVNAEYPVGESRQLIEAVERQISGAGLESAVEMDTRFLSDDEALSKLSECDLIVFGYQRSSESASGAVRYGLISGRPVAVTPLAIFSDVEPYTLQLPGISPREMAQGIADIMDRQLKDPTKPDAELASILDLTRRHFAERSYAALGPRLVGMLTALWDDQQNGLR